MCLCTGHLQVKSPALKQSLLWTLPPFLVLNLVFHSIIFIIGYYYYYYICSGPWPPSLSSNWYSNACVCVPKRCMWNVRQSAACARVVIASARVVVACARVPHACTLFVLFAYQVPVSPHLLGCCHCHLWVWGCCCAWVWGCGGPWRDAWRGAETVHSDCERADTKSGPHDPVPSHSRRQFPLSLSLSTSVPSLPPRLSLHSPRQFPLSLSLSTSLPLTLHVSRSHSPRLSLSLSTSLPLTLHVSPSHSPRLSLSLSTSLPPHPCFVCVRERICAYMHIYMHALGVL